MCDGTWKLMEPEYEWVYDLGLDLWKNAPTVEVLVRDLEPTQFVVTIQGMGSIEQMYRDDKTPDAHILTVRTSDGLLIRDGHHRYVRAFMLDTKKLWVQTIPDPR